MKNSQKPSRGKAELTPFGEAVDALRAALERMTPDDRVDAIETVKAAMHAISPLSEQPIDRVRWVPVEQVRPNDYNPNSVARQEMTLLYRSIKHDGYTQPVVVIWNPDDQVYEIVDGFHRYFTCKTNKDIRDRNRGFLPVVVIDKDINDRMAATVRHNRARGKHSVDGMANMVFSMLDKGWSDADICNELGMEAEELLRLKHITGFSKLFEDTEYRQAWISRRMAQSAREQRQKEARGED